MLSFSPITKRTKLFLVMSLFVTSSLVFQETVKAQTDSIVSHKKVKRILYGRASFYSNKFNGRKTANGEIFSQKKLTCACNSLPFGTYVRVINIKNDHSVIVKVNDRLHPKMRRVVDLTKKAAEMIGLKETGLAKVKVEVIGKKKPIASHND